MADTNSKKPVGPTTAGKGPRMYPSNSLPKQLRDPKDTLSAFSVLRKAYSASA